MWGSSFKLLRKIWSSKFFKYAYLDTAAAKISKLLVKFEKSKSTLVFCYVFDYQTTTLKVDQGLSKRYSTSLQIKGLWICQLTNLKFQKICLPGMILVLENIRKPKISNLLQSSDLAADKFVAP